MTPPPSRKSTSGSRVVWVGYVLPAVDSIQKRGPSDLHVFSTAEKAEAWRREWDELIADRRIPYGLSRQVHEMRIE